MATIDAFQRDRADFSGIEDETVKGLPPPSCAPAAAGVLAGMAAGAMAGSMAGPVGLIAGAVIGSVVGAAASIALDSQSVDDRRRSDELDREIGVFGGDIGAADPNAPPSVRGTFSAASMGVASGSGPELSEGPFPSAEDK